MLKRLAKYNMKRNYVVSDEESQESEEHEEYQYLNLIKDILEKGTLENGRNGNTISLFGASMRFSLQNNKIPILNEKILIKFTTNTNTEYRLDIVKELNNIWHIAFSEFKNSIRTSSFEKSIFLYLIIDTKSSYGLISFSVELLNMLSSLPR